MKMDVIEKARELGKMLMEDERCKRMQVAKAANNEDRELQAMIGEFNLLRIQLNNELSKNPPDKEKCKKYELSMKELYPKIMANKSMAEYNEAKKAVDELVGHINSIVQLSISGEVDSDTGCSGQCAGCAGCH